MAIFFVFQEGAKMRNKEKVQRIMREVLGSSKYCERSRAHLKFLLDMLHMTNSALAQLYQFIEEIAEENGSDMEEFVPFEDIISFEGEAETCIGCGWYMQWCECEDDDEDEDEEEEEEYE